VIEHASLPQAASQSRNVVSSRESKRQGHSRETPRNGFTRSRQFPRCQNPEPRTQNRESLEIQASDIEPLV
jgi:hypothetical protein